MVAETVAFHDTATGQSGGYHARLDAGSASDETVGVELQEFFRRPVRIGTFTWAESDAVATVRTFNPWALFFTDARVQYKLNNFAFIQCKLKVKVLINSSPFYYGSMYCGYQPLPNFTPSTISTDAGNRHLVLYSQRPCVWLTPQHNEGAEMELPFLYPRNWIDAQSAAAMVDMGQLSFINYTALQSANGVSSAGVSVAIYAWAEDVKLSGPSVGLATQGKSRPLRDEYGVGPVSSVASAVASTAGLLKNVPVIGKFATATQVGASAVSSIAKLFGWTNVPVIEDQKAFKPAPYPPMASTEIGYPIEKLTLDSKNELTVDPSAIGMSPEDELSVVALAQRESYLTTATWSTASTVDTILFTAQATPQLYDVAAQTKQAKVYLTPMAWVATLFTHWRGDIIFRFRIVASPYHKGRLRISFDPAGSSSSSIITDATTSNVVFTQIVDLGEDQDVEVRLPYQQALPYLLNPNLTEQNVQWSTSTTPPFMHAAGADNGTIVMRVQTALTAPVASSSINILVFVRAAENFEVANPRELPLTSPFTTQAKETPVGTGPPSDNETRNLVHFGETVASLRPVLRRFSMVGADHATALGTLYCAIMMKHFTKVPPAYGFDTAGGLQSASGNLTTGPFKFNFVQPHPLTWVMPAFVAYRGSVNWSFNAACGQDLQHLRVARVNDGVWGAKALRVFASIGPGATSNSIAQTALNAYAGAPGAALTSQVTNAGITVACPMMTPMRFQSTAAKNATVPVAVDGSNRDVFALELALNTITSPFNGGLVWSYAAAGTDFGLHFFLNVPTVFYYTSPITPV